MSHDISSEKGMPLQRIMKFIETADGMIVQVRWKGLPESEDIFEPVSKVYEDFPQLFMKMVFH